jgi:hypothetical protein
MLATTAAASSAITSIHRRRKRQKSSHHKGSKRRTEYILHLTASLLLISLSKAALAVLRLTESSTAASATKLFLSNWM